MTEEDMAAESTDTGLKDLILFCSVFPPDYEFTKDILVWQWIAGGLTQFTHDDDETMEEVCANSFHKLLNINCIVSSRYDYFIDQIKYKISDKIVTFIQKQLLIRDDDDKGMVEHMSFTFNQIDNAKHYKNLQTLIIHDCCELHQIPSDLFQELHNLKILNLSRTNISQFPNSVENLKELRFLDMSETPIGCLPETLACSSNLQTLNLDGCLQLNELPECTSKFTNMRHLVIDVARQLHSMPLRIGKLSKLHTLSAFLIGDGCSIGELKNMNKLRGSFRILKLENVATEEEAVEARLHEKVGLKKIELRWSDHLNRDSNSKKNPCKEEIILESLQPPWSIQELKISFYNGGVLPSWITNPEFNDLDNIILYRCRYLHGLPSLGELPSLKCLSIIENEEVIEINDSFCREQKEKDADHETVYVAFPKLEKLTFRSMSKLDKWGGVEKGDFPSLRHLIIESCPKFVGLPILRRLSSLSRLELRRCPELSGLPEGGLPTTLESWIIKECPKLKHRY